MTETETPKHESENDGLVGFRLERLEVLNWGTFDRQIWMMHLGGRNALLTGEIGSGKSTLVDALTALLVPSNRVAFNKAAGADARERTLRSYVLGYYKSERSESSGSAKPIALRDHNSYSVILGVFRNRHYQQTVTLAQVFWVKDPAAQPARFYAAHDRDLSIAVDFANFGSDILTLRKRLRTAGVQLFDSYPPYGAWLRRRLGIGHEQALDLFHQTVSMKSVGNLTDFVRNHMLEPFDVDTRIRALIGHFDDLNRAHEAVLNAKKQMDMLQPLVADCNHHGEIKRTTERLRTCRNALKPYFARIKGELLDKRIKQLTEEYARRDAEVAHLAEQRTIQQSRERELQISIAENGGERIEQLANEIVRLERDRDIRRKRADRYAVLAREAGLLPADTHDIFLSQKSRLGILRETAAEQEADLQNEQVEAKGEYARTTQEYNELTAEIESLKARRSNINSRQIAIRDALCAELGIRSGQMPFAGELIQVRQDEQDWEGAIERMLHGFALSLLVKDEHYARVAQWVDRTHLQARLVYYRIRPGIRSDLPALGQDSLALKLSLKPDSDFYKWLEREVAYRYADFICCSNQERFRREINALTRTGQIKSKGERHEKDDRYRLDDRSRYVLGWNNAAKMQALEAKAKVLRTHLAEILIRLTKLQQQQDQIRMRLDRISRLEEFADFEEMDWQPLALTIEALREEKARLESASDLLRSLNEQLKATRQELANAEGRLEDQKDKRSKLAQRRSDAESMRLQTQELLDCAPLPVLSEYQEELDRLRTEASGDRQLTIESCDNREQETRQWLQDRIDAEDKKLNRLTEKIVDSMRLYHSAFPLESQEADVSVEAAGEYRSMLEKLITDDLPRFESRFKELLNENTIREVVNFQGQLARERETIRERISRINESLTQIDYNPGRFILLEAQPTQDADVRDFQNELRACTEDALTGSESDQYSEAKFLQVKRIIERFRGREGHSDHDARWTAKVTDVRHWFIFAASERWKEDRSEYEHYSDSGGKSGGQKEKLAYTVLAASLAYQFGLELGEMRSRSFRFVAIDEAFGRGSDESAQYGLKLFSQFNLQLLIVTPLQKIHIIEPFIAGLGFVHSEDGRTSKLRNLSIEEYREERGERKGELDYARRHQETGAEVMG
jgi:uncharacterized protein YPO0396